ncbi:MAG: tetratricopeptide repeat protein [Flavobacteriales bacterium]
MKTLSALSFIFLVSCFSSFCFAQSSDNKSFAFDVSALFSSFEERKSFENQFFKALVSQQNNRHVEAIEALQLCLEYQSELPSVYSLLSKSYRATDRFREAETALQHAIELEPDNPWFQEQFIRYYIDIEDVDGLSKLYSTFSKSTTFADDMLHDIAEVYQKEKQFDLAKALCLELLERHPKDKTTYFRLITVLILNHEFKQANEKLNFTTKHGLLSTPQLKTILETIRLQTQGKPWSEFNRTHFPHSHITSQIIPEAPTSSWSHVLISDLKKEESDSTYQQLIALYLAENQLDSAQFWINKALESYHYQPKFHLQRGQVLVLKNKPEAARSAFNLGLDYVFSEEETDRFPFKLGQVQSFLMEDKPEQAKKIISNMLTEKFEKSQSLSLAKLLWDYNLTEEADQIFELILSKSWLTKAEIEHLKSN